MSKVIVKGALVRASFCKLFLSLFLAVLGLPCSTWSLFSCIEWRLVAAYELLIAVAMLLLLQSTSSGCRPQQVQCMALLAPRRVESSQTRGRTHIPCIGRQILNYWTARVVLDIPFFMRMCLQLHNFLSKYLCSLAFFPQGSIFYNMHTSVFSKVTVLQRSVSVHKLGLLQVRQSLCAVSDV